jgi:hypothetical protein
MSPLSWSCLAGQREEQVMPSRWPVRRRCSRAERVAIGITLVKLEQRIVVQLEALGCAVP